MKKQIKIELSKNLKADLLKGSIKADDMMDFLIENGWKTNKKVHKTALNDLYTKTHLIEGAHVDNDYVYLSLIEREQISIKYEITNYKISVSSENTNFINIVNIDPINFDAIREDIKALRAECRKYGVKFSCITTKKLNELMSEYIADFTKYTEQFYATKSFWSKLVRSGIYSGYTRETGFCPSMGIEKLTYRSAPINKLKSIADRINELKNEDISRFNMVAV